MVKKLKESRKTRYTRMVLQESLLELMIEKPIVKITITEICTKAEVNRTTFYTHFKDRYDLLSSIEQGTLSFLENLIKSYENKYSTSDILQMVEELTAYIAENKNSAQVLLGENGDINFQKKVFYYFLKADNVMRYFSKNSTNPAYDEYSYAFVINGVIGLLKHWLKNGLIISSAEIAKILVRCSYAPV